MLWFFKKMGDVGIFFEGNRPFLRLIYEPLLLVFGSHYFLWVLFSIFTRWLSGMALVWVLRQVWPRENVLITTAALAFLVYPGFQAQFSSMIFGVVFLLFSAFLFSLGLTIHSMDQPGRRNESLALSLLLSALALFTIEYFFTLELIRYFLIWIVLKNKNQKTIKEFIRCSFPYIVLFMLAILWRIVAVGSETTYSLTFIEQLKIAFLPGVLNLIGKSISDTWYTSILVWLKALYPVNFLMGQSARTLVLTFIMAALFGVGIFLTLKNLSPKNTATPTKPAFMNLLLFSVLSLALAGIPFWLAGLPVDRMYIFTRWTIPFMLGACLLIPIIVYKIFGQRVISYLILAIFLAQGAGTQLLAANSFRHEQEKLNNLFWQLKWRIPSLKEGTVLFSDMLDFHYENSDQLSSGINFALSSRDAYSSIPYFLFFIPERYQTSILPEIEEGITLSGKRYYSYFKGNTSQALLIDYQPPACLKVLDPAIDINNPYLDTLMKEALFLSKPNLISEALESPLDAFSMRVIGKPPEKAWCYFFEKADAAFQFKKWSDVVVIYQEAINKGLTPRDGREWVPFVESFAFLGDFDSAVELTLQAVNQDKTLKPLYCDVWSSIHLQTGSSQNRRETSRQLEAELKCNG